MLIPIALNKHDLVYLARLTVIFAVSMQPLQIGFLQPSHHKSLSTNKHIPPEHPTAMLYLFGAYLMPECVV